MLSFLFYLAAITAAAREGPCDITGAAGNPCVAAHSTTRALYANFDGALYNVTRSSDNTSTNVSVLQPGGFANAATHDAFCAAGDCVISNVFDQSPMHNHLGQRHNGDRFPCPRPFVRCLFPSSLSFNHVLYFLSGLN